jgi:hypothetical protein
MIPFVGWGATAGKAAKKVAGVVGDTTEQIAKHGDDLVDAGKNIAKNSEDVAETILKKYSDNGTIIRNSLLAGKKHPDTGVPFDKDGFPIFESQKDVQITFTGNRRADFIAANKEAGLGSTPKGMTWHHHQDGKTMQLVPYIIHRKTGHTGGFSLNK